MRASPKSLCARSAVFLLVGSGSLIGALFVISNSIVADAIDRILSERTDLAQTTGILIEERIRAASSGQETSFGPSFTAATSTESPR
jgi:hypothetical protein